MTLNTIILKLINIALNAQPDLRNKLSQHSGYTFIIQFTFVQISGTITTTGNINPCIANQAENMPQSTQPNIAKNYKIAIKIPFDIVSDIATNNKLELLKKISISGNSVVGLSILEILSSLKIDTALEAHAPPFITRILRKMVAICRKIAHSLCDSAKVNLYSLTEYLLYETQTIIGKEELNEFSNQVNLLQKRIDRLNNSLK